MSELPFRLEVGMLYRAYKRAEWIPVPGKVAEVLTKFPPGAFDYQIGSEVALDINGTRAGTMRLLAADIKPDGSGVTFTFQITQLEP